MPEIPSPDRQPFRVVLFTYGAVLQRDVKRFICRLETHAEIALVAVFCQTREKGYRAKIRDLWQRRRLLALPLLMAQSVETIYRHLRYPRAEKRLNRQIACSRSKIRFVHDLHDAIVIKQVRALNPDLGLIYGAPLLKPALFDVPRYGTLGIHHGRLPAYRGKKTTFWAMFNGEAMAGVTIQKVNAGLDTGMIVKQGAVPIGNRWQHEVWNDLEGLGFDLFIEAILEVKKGTATYRSQPRNSGQLYRDPTVTDILTLWLRQVRRKVTGI